MITLHLLQFLQDNGLGTIEEDLFYEKLPLDKAGVAIISRGGPLFRARNRAVAAFDFYSRGENDLLGADKLEKIWQLFVEEYQVCDLPIVPGKSNKQYTRVYITPVSNIENLGQDETDRLVFRLSCEAVYNK
jgi:hypothetical protein